ncbi:MAG: hypothetical protein ACK47B_09665 [Armatimonadota bacterium]
MGHFTLRRASLACGALLLAAAGIAAAAAPDVPASGRGKPTLVLAAPPENDLGPILSAAGYRVLREETPERAVERAPQGGGVLLLAAGYPERRTEVSPELLARVAARRLRVYLEYPAELPGIPLEARPAPQWERLVRPGKGAHSRHDILEQPGLQYLHASLPAGIEPLLVAARVAGFDHAVYGVPKNAAPILFRLPGSEVMVATTRLSAPVTSRATPQRQWESTWSALAAWLAGTPGVPELRWKPVVAPAFGPQAKLPGDVERRAFRQGVEWYHRSDLLLPAEREAEVHAALRQNVETTSRPARRLPADGSHGILEGYASGIDAWGHQRQRLPLRADCQAESAMVLAGAWALRRDRKSREVGENLLEYLYERSGLHGGVHADPTHPAFGLIKWGAVSPLWEVATYGDDEARTLLATLAATGWTQSSRWDRSVLRALLANLRTTGRLGFRGDRIDLPELERRGWKSFYDAERVNLSPHFEAYLWACYLWGYRATGEREFLDRTREGIRRTMDAYPSGWRWRDNLDRARMILALAWLVRVDDRPQHREWLTRVTRDMLRNQRPSGALAEEVNEQGGGGHLHVPPSNESYGTGETPLIQKNGDPVSDQLYTTGFALFGLREAAAATGEPWMREAEDRLARYLCRIQIRAPEHPYLDGAWFRAFDYGRWEYFGSSGDIGWGPWCVETGWGQSWILATLALREQQSSLWSLIEKRDLRPHLAAVRAELARNDGSPHRR